MRFLRSGIRRRTEERLYSLQFTKCILISHHFRLWNGKLQRFCSKVLCISPSTPPPPSGIDEAALDIKLINLRLNLARHFFSPLIFCEKRRSVKNVLILYWDRRIFFLERFAASLAFVPFNYSFDFSLHVSAEHINNGDVSHVGLERSNVTSGLGFPNQLSTSWEVVVFFFLKAALTLCNETPTSEKYRLAMTRDRWSWNIMA